MRKIITYGTFDLLHIGHINILSRCKSMGDCLIVGLSTDEFNNKKNKSAYFKYEHRKEILQSIKYVDKVIPEESWDQKIEDIKKYNVDIFVIGDDWRGKFDYLKEYCKVIYLPRTEGVSTSDIKSNLKLAD